MFTKSREAAKILHDSPVSPWFLSAFFCLFLSGFRLVEPDFETTDRWVLHKSEPRTTISFEEGHVLLEHWTVHGWSVHQLIRGVTVSLWLGNENIDRAHASLWIGCECDGKVFSICLAIFGWKVLNSISKSETTAKSHNPKLVSFSNLPLVSDLSRNNTVLVSCVFRRLLPISEVK